MTDGGVADLRRQFDAGKLVKAPSFHFVEKRLVQDNFAVLALVETNYHDPNFADLLDE